MSRGAMYVVQCLAERPGDKAPRVCVARAWSLQTAGAQASREMATHASRFQQGARPERNTEADPTQLPRYGARGQTTELPKGELLRARLQRLIPEEGTTLVLMEHRHTLEVRRHCSAREGHISLRMSLAKTPGIPERVYTSVPGLGESRMGNARSAICTG